MTLRKPFLYVAVAVAAVVALAALARAAQGDDTSRVGGTVDLVEEPRWPVRWESNDTVVFQTWVGATTVRLDGTVISSPREAPNAPSTHPGRSMKVDAEARFGPWSAWDGGHYLIKLDGDEKCGPPLVPSPDGKFIACARVVNDRLNETNDAYGAVIRIRR